MTFVRRTYELRAREKSEGKLEDILYEPAGAVALQEDCIRVQVCQDQE